MIKSKTDLQYYIEADRIANGLPKYLTLKIRNKNVLFPNYIWKFLKTLRKLEYYQNCKSGGISILSRYLITKRHNKLSLKLGFSIPTNVFGAGLSIPHHGTIIVNGGAKIGSNCRLHACVNIGTEAGYGDKAPFIGDNCYIGPGVKVYGDIKIANGTAVGANAVVNKSFSEENIAIGGVPAKKIGEVDTFDFLVPATILIDSGYNKDHELSGLTSKEIKEKMSHQQNT